MVNQILLKIQAVPKLLLGFILICLALVVLYFQNPPMTICDIQMEEVNKRLADGFFRRDSRGGNFESGVMTVFNNCLDSNSPGGCHEIFERIDYLEGLVKTIPTECGEHPATAKIKKFLAKALRLLAIIAWGEKKPINKYNKTSWLDTSDIGLFCRLKTQFIRLYGKQTWNGFIWGFVPRLPDLEGLSKKEIWERTLFSYNCANLL